MSEQQTPGQNEPDPSSPPSSRDVPWARPLPMDYVTPARGSRLRGIVFACLAAGAVVFILLFAVAILIPSTGAASERANRVKCASNLRQIGQGLMLYSNCFKTYPRTRYDPTKPLTAFTPAAGAGQAPDESDPYSGPNRPADNDVAAALFLLVRHVDVTPDVFVCRAQTRSRTR